MSVTLEILLPGIPVTSTRGALGWCTIALLEQEGKKILFDTGSFNVRSLLPEQLKKRGLSPRDIDIVFISHLHYDHVVNAEVFSTADLLVSAAELEYATAASDDPYIPASMIRLLKDRFKTLAGDHYISEGIKAVSLPGHTPGHMGLFIEEDRVLVAGDAVKNAWDFVHAAPPSPYYSEEASLQSYKRIKSMVNIVVPGHDRPFRLLEGDRIEYTQAGSAEIRFYSSPYEDARIIRIP